MPPRTAGLPTSASPAALKRGLKEVLSLVEQHIDTAIAHPHADPEVLHELHRDLRRLAGGLSMWADLLVPRDAADIPPIVQRLRRFARLVGRVRDRDVTVELLEPLLRARSRREERQELHRFLARTREDGRTGRELLRAFLTTERRGGLLDQIRAILLRPVRPGGAQQLSQIFEDEWHTHRRRVRKAHRKARRRPSIDRLHRLRIRIRRWRHLVSLAEIARVPAPPPVEPAWRALQDRLGHLHDLDVALTSLPPELGGSTAAQRLGGALRREEDAVRTLLEEHREATPHRKARRASARAGG